MTDLPPMKALTLHQPWASLIALGVKTIETRGWKTDYRGPLAIHAAKRKPADQLKVGPWTCFPNWLHDPTRMMVQDDCGGFPSAVTLPLGAVVAVCDLTDCLQINPPGNEPQTAADAECEPHSEFICRHIDDALTLYEFGHGGHRPPTRSDDISNQLPYGDFTPGRYGWVLDNVRPVDPPQSAAGRQGLWNWAGDHD